MASHRPKANDVADVTDRTRSWRKGIMHAVQSNLYDAELTELVEGYIYTTRPLPGTIFSFLWKCLLDYLQLHQEERCVNVLLKTYLEKDESGAIAAVWRCGVDRMIPATATASQAQEAWHYHRLRPGLGERKQSLDSFLKNLKQFLGTRALQLERGPPVFQVVPAKQWDRTLISGLMVADGSFWVAMKVAAVHRHLFPPSPWHRSYLLCCVFAVTAGDKLGILLCN
jgi:hypothetical protein